MNENSIETNKYNFIKNLPLGEDLFNNKSQDKIALVISEKIINEPDFKIIGIDGEWGSGKSNLVKLIENKLDKSHKFFVYDVWGHQEDEQRHSILLELTDFITRENIVKGNSDWKEKLKVLISKQKNTTTTNIPHLSIGFIISLLLIIYVPTVNAFAKDLDTLYKIPIVLLPILFLLGLYIKFYIQYRNEGKIISHNGLNRWDRFKKYGQEAAQELFKVYHSQKKAETKIEVISENEPTVKEFRGWMRQIDVDLNKKVVIVFDNFDRLPKKHIQSIWSSIHIFFAEEPYDNIKVIIPFDREHVQNAFKELNGDIDTKFGDDYVNKTFDIVFRVTKPIMSNWKEFFETQWKKAFVNYEEEELRFVVQVYEFLNRRITPREIISFINEILTIKLLDEKFKERYIAIFVLRKDEILKDTLKAVTDFKDLLGGLYYIYSNDSDYAKQLTAIIYHIEVDKALELIYTQELKDSMLKNDVQRFNEICNSDFINSIFYSTVLDIDTFENPVLTLASIKVESNVSQYNIQKTWELFNYRVLQLDSSISKFKIDKWQINLINSIADNQYLAKILDGYFKLINDSNIENYIDLVDDLIIELKEDRVLDQLMKRNISHENFIKLIEYSGKSYKKYNLFTDYKLLDQHLSKLNINEILKLKNTECLPEEYDFKSYEGILKLNLNSLIDQNDIQSANDVLIKIKERYKKNESLKDLLEDSRIYSLYINFSSSDLPIINELIAMRIAKGSDFHSSYVNQFTNVLNSEDDNRAEEISKLILNYISYGDLLLLSKNFADSLLFKQIILKMFDKSDLGKSANIITLIENYSEIKDSLDIEDDLLLLELNKFIVDKSKLDVNKLSDVFIDDCISFSGLNISKDFLMVFNEDFKVLDISDYNKVFDDVTDVHFKYFKYLKLNCLTQASLDVFESKFIEVLKSNYPIDEQRWNILDIYDSNNSSLSVVNTFKNILDEILTSKIVLKVDTAIKLLSYFIKHDLLNGRNDIFRLLIKNEFLSSSDFIRLLTSNSEHIKKLYKNALPVDKEGFRNLLNEKRENNSEFETLAKSLDIRKVKVNSDDSQI